MTPIDPIEGLKWAVAATTLLGGVAFGIKRLLTLWGKESSQASGVAAANDIITALREEVDLSRKNTRMFAKESELAQIRIYELQKQVTQLQNANNKLQLNNDTLKEQLGGGSATSHGATFSATNIGDLS